MLLATSDEYDTRVRKEAETLTAAGYDVRVVSFALAGQPRFETTRGVTYERVEVRESTRRAWQEHRHRQARALTRLQGRFSGLPTTTGDGVGDCTAAPQRGRGPIAASLVKLARVAYRTKLRMEREIYLIVRAIRWHSAYAAAVSEPLARFAPDVLHAHDLLTLDAGRRYARLWKLPLVYDTHELALRSRRYWRLRDRVVASVVEWRGIRAASAVVTVSPQIADWLARRYRIETPTVLLNSPPLGASRLPPPFSLRSVCGLEQNAALVVYTGGIQPGRGLDRTIDALAALAPHYHFAVVGPGRGGQGDEEMQERARSAGVLDRLHLVEPVPGHLVSSVITEADAAVVPLENMCLSYDLTLPNKLFEAVLAGLPLATSSLRATAEFVCAHAVGSVFEVGDPRAIAEAIREVVEHPPPGIGDRGRLAALQEDVCWERQGEKLCALYERLRGDARW